MSAIQFPRPIVEIRRRRRSSRVRAFCRWARAELQPPANPMPRGADPAPAWSVLLLGVVISVGLFFTALGFGLIHISTAG